MSVSARSSCPVPVVLRELTVHRVSEVTPAMRRITLTGSQLGEFHTPEGTRQAAFSSPGFDDDIRLLFPYPGESAPVLPLVENGRVTFAAGRRPIARAYSVRRYDPHSRELDVDVVLHGDGVASGWAHRAHPGDAIHIVGPGSTRTMPTGHDWFLVAGDETAIPAIGRYLDELPRDARGRVLIEVAASDHRLNLRHPGEVEVSWIVRGGSRPQTLLEAVREMTWQPGAPFVWLAGEQSEVQRLRRFLVSVREVPKSGIDFTGYWKRGSSGLTSR